MHFPVTENFPISTSRAMYAHPPYKYGINQIALSPQWLAIAEDTQLIRHIGASAQTHA